MIKSKFKKFGIGVTTAATAIMMVIGASFAPQISHEAHASAASGATPGGGTNIVSYDGGRIVTYIGIPKNWNTDVEAINYVSSQGDKIFRGKPQLSGNSSVKAAVNAACNSARARMGGKKSKTVLVQVALGDSALDSSFKHYYGTYGSNAKTYRTAYNDSSTQKTLKDKLGKAAAFSTIKNRHASIIGGSGLIKASCTVATENDLTPPPLSIIVTVKDKQDINGAAYAYNTTVSSQYLVQGGSFSPEEVNTTNTKITKFGKLFDEYKNKSNTTRAQYFEFLKEATEAVALENANPTKDVTVNLSDENRNKLADGGVMNVSQRAIMQPLSASHEKVYKATFTGCTKRFKNNLPVTYKTDDEAKSYLNRVYKNYGCSQQTVNGKKYNYTTSKPSKDEWGITYSATTPKEIGFWQVLSMHCNKEGFEKITKDLSSIAKPLPQETTNEFTGVLVTDKFESKEKAAKAIQGTSNGSYVLGQNAGKFASTGTKGFYDKECPFDCIPDEEELERLNPGAKAYDVGLKQVNRSTQGVNTVDFSMFRDNENRAIEVLRWVPATKNGISYDGAKASTTSISVEPTSTPWTEPKPEAGLGGKFSLLDSSGKSVFGKDRVKEQKNWSEDRFRAVSAGVIKGEHTKFDAKGSWASDDGKPVRLNFKWEYAPEVSTSIPVKSVGFTSNGSKYTGIIENTPRPIEGKCYANFENTGKSIDTVDLFVENTGTGTQNNLDGGMVDSSKGRTDITITFVRATTS